VGSDGVIWDMVPCYPSGNAAGAEEASFVGVQPKEPAPLGVPGRVLVESCCKFSRCEERSRTCPFNREMATDHCTHPDMPKKERQLSIDELLESGPPAHCPLRNGPITIALDWKVDNV